MKLALQDLAVHFSGNNNIAVVFGRRSGGLVDVTQGNNDWFNQAHGASCGNDYLCVAKKGYDAPTGLGTPDGTGAF